MPNLKAAITGFDNFCKVGSKMLLDLHHDFAQLKGDLVREAGARFAMPTEQKPTQPNPTGAAKEAVARVPERPVLKTQAEFDTWLGAYSAQIGSELAALPAVHSDQVDRDMLSSKSWASTSVLAPG